jgi:hypothetical protein
VVVQWAICSNGAKVIMRKKAIIETIAVIFAYMLGTRSLATEEIDDA